MSAVTTTSLIYDVAVLGGGIVGLSAARQIAMRHPKLKMCLVEKDTELASHQSKRNSGVVHCGIYYKKGSLKSRFCIKGSKLAFEYCQSKGIPVQKCGKLIVATKESEIQDLHDLYNNAKSNKIEDIQLLSNRQASNIQPGCTKALETIWSPNTAIVNWQHVALSYADDFRQLGGRIYTDFLAMNIKSDMKTLTVTNLKDRKSKPIQTKSLVVCVGAYSSTLAPLLGASDQPKIVPFRGDYYLLSDRIARTVKTNIYPVPDPKLPFLGVHITPRIDGSVIVGPTARLSLSHEPYISSFNPLQAYDILVNSGVLNMLRNKDYRNAGIAELSRLFFKNLIVQDLQQFMPEIQAFDLIDTNFYGVRAQAVAKDGKLVDDFILETSSSSEYSKVLLVRNCPSPAATSSLAIAERIANVVEEQFI